ncbi:hypothetical protein PIB30_067131 [Stylosanthes scabra]|uniref:Uncharacterized protein n=1 Tax=Stylosanthes scabra TaxID=79078 RepID=A0ABU6UL96_9FABA|nr:hypothetical protein [Stylosanthes scabra]
MISFSPYRYPSPYQEGTSSYHEHGHFQQHPFSPHQADTSAYHQQPFVPQTQEHTGLDELYQMTTCPPAEFSSIVNTFRMTRAQHSDPGGSGPWCPTYSSPPMMGTPAFDPRTISGRRHGRTTHPLHITASPMTDTAPHPRPWTRPARPPQSWTTPPQQIIRSHHRQAGLGERPDIPLVVPEVTFDLPEAVISIRSSQFVYLHFMCITMY